MCECENIIILKARYDPDRYFIFRNNGQEVDFKFIDDKLIVNPKYILTLAEREFIYINIQKFYTKNEYLLNLNKDY
jgi:hypothetical protein